MQFDIEVCIAPSLAFPRIGTANCWWHGTIGDAWRSHQYSNHVLRMVPALSVVVGCVLLAMPFLDVLSGQGHGMSVIPWPHSCLCVALLIVLSMAWPAFPSNYESVISNGLICWLVVFEELFWVLASCYTQIVRDDCVRWLEWNGIVHSILK